MRCAIHPVFPGGPVVKNLPAHAGGARDASSIPGLGRSPGGGNGNLLQHPRLENPMDRGAWWAIVHRVTKNRERRNDWVYTHYIQYDWKLGCKDRYPDWEKAMWRWRQRLEWCIYKPRIVGRSQKLGKGKEGHSPRDFRESGALPAHWSGASGPQDSERNVLF